MGKLNEEVAKATRDYQATLKNLNVSVDGYDAARAGFMYWRDLTGSCAAVQWTNNNIDLNVWLSDTTVRGQFVTRRHFNEMVEIVDDFLVSRGHVTEVSYQESYALNVYIKTPTFQVCLSSFPGGVCERKVVNSTTVTIDEYGWECD